MANDPFSGPEVLPLMFQMPFSFIYLCMKFVSMKQKVIFYTQCVLSLNRTLPGVSVLWGLMFDCIMHTQILFFIANKILLARQRKSSSCSFLFLSLSLCCFSSFSLFIPQCNRENWGVEIFQGVDEDSDSSRGGDVSPKGGYTDSTGLPAAQRKCPCALQVPDLHLWSHLPSSGKSRGNSLRLVLSVHFNSFLLLCFQNTFRPQKFYW